MLDRTFDVSSANQLVLRETNSSLLWTLTLRRAGLLLERLWGRHSVPTQNTKEHNETSMKWGKIIQQQNLFLLIFLIKYSLIKSQLTQIVSNALHFLHKD